MTLPNKTSAAALVAVALPLFAGSAAAAPLSQSLALSKAEASSIEQVQYRRWHRGGYYVYDAAPSGYYAYGAAPSGYYAYGAAPGGYYAYGAAPGGYYAYGAGPRYGYRAWNYGNGSAATGPGSAAICPPDRDQASGYPSWMCR